MERNASVVRRFSTRPVLAPLGIFVAVCAVFVGLFAFARRLEDDRTASEYAAASSARIRAVTSALENDRRLLEFTLTDFRALLATRVRTLPNYLGIVRNELSAISGELMASEADLLVMACLLRVLPEESDAFQALARAHIDGAFRIYELNEAGEPEPGETGRERFPAIAALPAAQATALVGFDFGSVPVLEGILARARERGQPEASIPMTIRPGHPMAVWVAGAIYRTAVTPSTAEERRRELAGYIVMALRPDVLFEESLGGLFASGIDLLLEDETDPLTPIVVAAHSSRTRTAAIAPEAMRKESGRSSLAESVAFRFADRAWRLTTNPAPAFFASRWSWQSWMVLAVGVLLAALVAGTFRLSVSRRRRIEEVVEQRTADLTREVREREQIAEQLKEAEKVLTARLDELDRRSAEIELLNRMGEMLQRCLTTDEALPAISRFGELLFPRDAGIVYLYDQSERFVELATGWGRASGSEAVFAVERCWALRSGKPHAVDDASHDVLCAHVGPPAEGTAMLCVPLMAQSQIIGLLHLRGPGANASAAGAPQALTARRALAVTAADQISLALANIRLREVLRDQSIRDPLTGLFNRRYMEESIHQTLHRAHRTGSPLGVIMIDIDHFKRYNDDYGHDAGDAILRGLGAFLRGELRESDTACRYGGEEFAIIMPDATLEVAQQRAERMRVGVGGLKVTAAGASLLPVTLSLGIAAYPTHATDQDSLLAAADQALYRAKREGRNRAVVAHFSPAAPAVEPSNP